MIRSCPRNHPAQITPRTSSFILFKPLIAIASLAIMFELLPLDFQSWIAPSLVPYNHVFWSLSGADVPTTTSQELIDNSCIAEQGSHYVESRPGLSL